MKREVQSLNYLKSVPTRTNMYIEKAENIGA